MALSYHDIARYMWMKVNMVRRLGKTWAIRKGPLRLYNLGHTYQKQGKDSLALSYYHEVVKQGS